MCWVSIKLAAFPHSLKTSAHFELFQLLTDQMETVRWSCARIKNVQLVQMAAKTFSVL